MKQRCLARAYGDEPLNRFAVGVGDGLVYVVSPDLPGTDGEVALRSIGFPSACIYELDDGVYESILEAYRASDRDRLDQMWRKAKPLRLTLPDIDEVIRLMDAT